MGKRPEWANDWNGQTTGMGKRRRTHVLPCRALASHSAATVRPFGTPLARGARDGAARATRRRLSHGRGRHARTRYAPCPLNTPQPSDGPEMSWLRGRSLRRCDFATDPAAGWPRDGSIGTVNAVRGYGTRLATMRWIEAPQRAEHHH